MLKSGSDTERNSVSQVRKALLVASRRQAGRARLLVCVDGVQGGEGRERANDSAGASCQELECEIPGLVVAG